MNVVEFPVQESLRPRPADPAAVLDAARKLVDHLHDYVHGTERIDDEVLALLANGAAAASPRPVTSPMGALPAAIASPVDRRTVEPDWQLLAREEYAARRERERLFDVPGLFGEPAWDMLLDIFAVQMGGKRISVTSACIGACVPPTTALRWLTVLEKSGLAERKDDPADARRSFVALTRRGIALVKQYLSARAARTSGAL